MSPTESRKRIHKDMESFVCLVFYRVEMQLIVLFVQFSLQVKKTFYPALVKFKNLSD